MRRREHPVAGRYVLLEELGRGATAVVRRAHDLRQREHVAAKVLHDPTDPAARAALARERARPVEHPHVLGVTDAVEEDGAVMITMELARGGSLRDRTLAPTLAVLLLGQLLDALAAVHAAGVVHGDVKPANLLLRGGAPHLLLTDFGVATAVDTPLELVAAGPVGTPAYLPPELRTGGPAHPGQDVYAVGVLARRLVPPGPLTTLWDSMTRPEAERRPGAAQARRRLRELTAPR